MLMIIINNIINMALNTKSYIMKIMHFDMRVIMECKYRASSVKTDANQIYGS